MRTNTRKHPVISSNLATVGYSRKYKILDITFQTSGDTYRYFNVPRRIFERLMRAPSKGIYYNTFIRGNKDYTPIKLNNSNPDPKPMFTKTDATYINNHRYLVINGQTGAVVRVSSSADWAVKDAETWANKYPQYTYYPVMVLGEAAVRSKAVFLPGDLKNQYKG
jgi:hypothetical protein